MRAQRIFQNLQFYFLIVLFYVAESFPGLIVVSPRGKGAKNTATTFTPVRLHSWVRCRNQARPNIRVKLDEDGATSLHGTTLTYSPPSYSSLPRVIGTLRIVVATALAIRQAFLCLAAFPCLVLDRIGAVCCIRLATEVALSIVIIQSRRRRSNDVVWKVSTFMLNQAFVGSKRLRQCLHHALSAN